MTVGFKTINPFETNVDFNKRRESHSGDEAESNNESEGDANKVETMSKFGAMRKSIIKGGVRNLMSA